MAVLFNTPYLTLQLWCGFVRTALLAARLDLWVGGCVWLLVCDVGCGTRGMYDHGGWNDHDLVTLRPEWERCGWKWWKWL